MSVIKENVWKMDTILPGPKWANEMKTTGYT